MYDIVQYCIIRYENVSYLQFIRYILNTILHDIILYHMI